MINKVIIGGIFSIAAATIIVAADREYRTGNINFELEEVATGLDFPWGMAFLPNGDLLVTERDAAQLRIVRNGKLDPNPISGLPLNIAVGGQGGLLDVAIDPDFQSNNYIYLTYAGSGEAGRGTELIRAKLENDSLVNVEHIFITQPKTSGSQHYGGRIAFDQAGHLYLTIGDRGRFRDEAQNPQNHLGSVIRINTDGSIPAANPFTNNPTNQADIYSFGHRNPQGLAMRSDGSMWLHEHGPRGGDELNKLDKAGANYGWPAITYGIDYSGAVISDKTALPGMEQPVTYWVPSIAPSGMSFYDGDLFPDWQGDLFIGALAGQHLRRIVLEGDKVIDQEVLLPDFARIREVENGPDGALYIATDDYDGSIFRLQPIK